MSTISYQSQEIALKCYNEYTFFFSKNFNDYLDLETTLYFIRRREKIEEKGEGTCGL